MQAHKAIEAVRRLRGNPMPTDQAELLERKITEAVKFEFDFGEFPVLSQEAMEDHIENLRLPFPLCYFEIPGVGALLARENGNDRYILVHPFLYGLYGSKEWGTWPPEVMLAICKDTGTLISLSEDESIQRDLEKSCGDEQQATIISALPSMVIRGLSVMNCSNVKCMENPPPKFLNKKRAKHGKVPMFSYWTLHISAGEQRSAEHGNVAQSGRSGPRLHLRRGHIRRLPSGATTWVQPCVVGEQRRGVVSKDYRVSA